MKDNLFILNVVRFLGLLFLQLFVLNEIELHNFINPYIYPLIILLFARTTKPWLLMLLAFFTGIIVDANVNTLGMHASAAVFLAFIRPAILQFFQPRLGYNEIEDLGSPKLGFQWFVAYTSIGVLAHHIFYFIIEAWDFTFFISISMRILCSFLVSMLMIIIYKFTFATKRIN